MEIAQMIEGIAVGVTVTAGFECVADVVRRSVKSKLKKEWEAEKSQ